MISKKSAKAGDSIPHESAHLHVTGQATYIDDLPELENTMHLAVGFSNCAKGKIIKFDLDSVRQADGVCAVFSAKDIEVENNWGPIVTIKLDNRVYFTSGCTKCNQKATSSLQIKKPYHPH